MYRVVLVELENPQYFGFSGRIRKELYSTGNLNEAINELVKYDSLPMIQEKWWVAVELGDNDKRLLYTLCGREWKWVGGEHPHRQEVAKMLMERGYEEREFKTNLYTTGGEDDG